MNRITLLSLIAFLLIVSGLASLNPALVAMSFVFIAYLFIGLATYPGEFVLIINRSLDHSRAEPGTPIEVTLSVISQGKKIESVLIEDILSPKLSVTSGSPRHLVNLKPGGITTWKYTIKGKRGCYQFDTIHVEFRDIFGILPKRKIYSTEGELLILPNMLNVKRISIRPRKTRVYSGEIPARSGGLGVEFFGVREFQPGDLPQWINWRASARHPSSLFSNEYEQERVADVGIILDGRERTNVNAEGASIFEHSVLSAATLTNTFLNQGNRVSLLHYGKYLHWVYPGYGKYQREKILRALSDVKPGHSMVFAYLEHIPTQIFPPQSQIVLISPLISADTRVLLQLRAIGYSVLVISPDPIAYEHSKIRNTKEVELAVKILNIERKLQLNKLVQGGIRVVDWDVAIPFDQVVGSLKSITRDCPFSGSGMMVRILTILCTLIGFGLPVGYYINSGIFIPALILILLGISWLVQTRIKLPWLKGFALIGGVAANAVGVWLQFPRTEMILSTILMIWSWDLSNFLDLVRQASPGDPITDLENQHLKTTSIFFLIVFLASQLAITVELKPTFIQAMILTIGSFIGLMQMVRWLVSKTKST